MLSKIKKLVKVILWRTVPDFYYNRAKPKKGAEFSIAILKGDSLLDLYRNHAPDSAVLTCRDVTDVPSVTAADPFITRKDGKFYLFFEVVSMFSHKGEIAYATSLDGSTWVYQRVVLAEPYHLSYPYIFEWEKEYYMIPEGSRGGDIKLYKAANFPDNWQFVKTLLSGKRFVDNSIFFYNNTWYLYSDTGKEPKSPVLSLYYADNLLGPWNEHPCSPIVEGDPHISRPSGRVQLIDGKPVRFAQDVYPVYGSAVNAFEITELSTTSYAERPVDVNPILSAGTANWNQSGMHHIDAILLDDGKWLACVDGFKWRDA